MDSTRPGRTVLVHSAAGGVGLAAVQLAKAAGARVFGTVSSDAKAGLVKECGADAIINYEREKFGDAVLRMTDNRGADLILDAVGKPTFEEGLRCLAPFGHLVLYGRAGGPTDPLNVQTLSPKCLKVSAFSMPTVTRNFPDMTRDSADRCFALMREGRLKLHIGKTFPLSQAADAHRHLESRASTGKLILLP
jgi:NADPH2:quinone reductase